MPSRLGADFKQGWDILPQGTCNIRRTFRSCFSILWDLPTNFTNLLIGTKKENIHTRYPNYHCRIQPGSLNSHFFPYRYLQFFDVFFPKYVNGHSVQYHQHLIIVFPRIPSDLWFSIYCQRFIGHYLSLLHEVTGKLYLPTYMCTWMALLWIKPNTSTYLMALNFWLI